MVLTTLSFKTKNHKKAVSFLICTTTHEIKVEEKTLGFFCYKDITYDKTKILGLKYMLIKIGLHVEYGKAIEELKKRR